MGDVVSLMDHDGGIFYAQIRGFIQDQYMEKSVVLTWLLPTTSSPAEGFDPATFVIGKRIDVMLLLKRLNIKLGIFEVQAKDL